MALPGKNRGWTVTFSGTAINLALGYSLHLEHLQGRHRGLYKERGAGRL
jgi:hypothetical protein